MKPGMHQPVEEVLAQGEVVQQEVVIEEIRAIPCDCIGDCKNGFEAENCAAWLARSHKMTMELCSNSQRPTWHRDGKCASCHPLFPPSYLWGNA